MSSTEAGASAPKALDLPGRMAAIIDRPQAASVALLVILLIAGWLRFTGLNWDEGRHLHPDERFLSTVTNDLKWPQGMKGYFDPATSTLSPYSLPNMGLYIYGMLPVYLVKAAAILLHQDNYDRITQIGRAMSGIFDLGAILLLFLIGRRLHGVKTGLLAAGLMSVSVLNIQLSHFYAVDTFANLFILATFFFLLRAVDGGRWVDFALTGLMFGLGLSSKLSAMTLAAPILVMGGLDLYRRIRRGDARLGIEQSLVRLFTLFAVAFITFRIVQPIAFSGPSFWDLSLNPRWVADVVEQQKTASGKSDLPWVQQWTGRSAFYPLYNIIFWGLGLPLGVAALAGLALAGYELWRYRRLQYLFPLIYVGVTFVYHALTFVKFMRYFLPIYPFLTLAAAGLIIRLWQAPDRAEGSSERVSGAGVKALALLQRIRRSPALVIGITVVVLGGTLLYAVAFTGIYSRQHPRIAASRWMYTHIPAGATLANEHWDDWLPIGGVDGKTAYGNAGLFKSVEMKNYEDDTPEKLDQMVSNLEQADYIVVSSNRLYGSIPRLPMRYPLMIRYYDLLFSGKLGFERIVEFTSYPSLFGIQLHDQAAEESFSVYDHPRVQIFRKTAAFDAARLRAELGEGIQWSSVIHMTPWEASAAPHALMFTAGEEALYQRGAQTSSREVNEGSWGSRVPLLAWFLVLEALALIALPITLIAFRNLADRGYILSKAAGLLLTAWGAWLIASLRIAPFTWWLILLVLALLLAGSLYLARRHWDELRGFIRAHWQTLVLEEALFWIFFALMLFIRMKNPDLWHPGMGGEKPMDLAYLTAIVRTPYFPSYDPWFAGGYINYYYFGFVLVATLIHLTGIVEHVAYNLAVPTLFAMTAMGAFSVALSLAASLTGSREPSPAGQSLISPRLLLAAVCGALFVAVIGNLGQVQLLADGVRHLSVIQSDGTVGPLVWLAQFFDGLSHWLAEHKLPWIHTDWWYWNATRIIPPAEGEAGPINEMPFFTFLFGDLHAHAMALPYTLLALGLAVNILRSAKPRSAEGHAWWRDTGEVLTLALLALTTGALWPLNTWDFPTYTVLAAAALLFGEYARRGRLDAAAIWAGAWRALLVVIAGRILFLPFHQSYAGSYLGAEIWKGSHTPLKAYLLIHGFFLFVIASYLISELLQGKGHNSLVRWIRLSLRNWRRIGRLEHLLGVLVRPTAAHRLASDSARIALLLVLALGVIRPVIGLALGLALLAALLLFSARPEAARQFLLSMIGLGLVLTAVVEVIVLKGDISRMNTVFKFYLQVWVLWGVTSAAVLPLLAGRLRGQRSGSPSHLLEVPEGSPWTPEVAAEEARWRKSTARARRARTWWWGFGLILAACLLYPLTAAPVKMGDRFPDSHTTTLDGSAYMRTSVYYDDGRPVTLDWDRQAFDWLRRNVKGIPNIIEANTPLYRWGSRVSINTGLPTVIGWDWHQKQQRAVIPGQVIERRIQDVNTIYTTTDLTQAEDLLRQYNVKYIYVGPLEQLYYAGDGLKKFDQASNLWNLVYENKQVRIFQVH